MNSRLIRDSLLRRQKEGRYGFKLFMRAFAIVLAYHSSRSIGSSSFSFEALTPDLLTKAGEHLKSMLDETVRVLERTANVVRRVMCCDDFRMLPDTESFWPVFQLFTRFPGIDGSLDNRLGSIVLRLVLGDMQKKDVLRLCADINRTQSLNEAMSLFDAHPRLRVTAFERAVRDRVNDAKALTSRGTMVLYWLLRKQQARDFSYDVNLEERAAELKKRYSVEALLEEAVAPERQHIVPYKRLKVLFGLEGGARPGRHDAHDIGNLTYISSGLNGFVLGVGSRPLKLEAEGLRIVTPTAFRPSFSIHIDGSQRWNGAIWTEPNAKAVCVTIGVSALSGAGGFGIDPISWTRSERWIRCPEWRKMH